MKAFMLLCFIFTTQLVLGQEKSLDKKALKKIFSIDRGQKSKDFVICNSNKQFFKNDTLYLFDNTNFFYQSNECCEFVDWRFLKHNLMVQNESQICKEPATSKVTNSDNIYNIKIKQKDNAIYLKRYRKGEPIDEFLIIRITKLELPQEKRNYNKIELIRIK